MTTIIHWFRQDLRLSDNLSLFEAAKIGNILPIYILDTKNLGQHEMGGTTKVWLHYALEELNKSLGGKLLILKGDPKEILKNIIKKFSIEAIYWNHCYEPWCLRRDKEIKEYLNDNDVDVKNFNSSLLWDPSENLKSNGEHYKIFTPYYKNAFKNIIPRLPVPKPDNLKITSIQTTYNDINYLNLLPNKTWYKSIIASWNIGEEAAKNCLSAFLSHGIKDYKEGRNFPGQKNNSRLSPYLHFGHISPNQVWHAVRTYNIDNDIENFCFELGWREFSYNLIYHNPTLPHKNLQTKFDNFPWKKNKNYLEKWQQGKTGYPIVDAGMRELWQTGFMHNRVRMIVGSFLVKNLLIDWREGERWFWDCLVDADIASNSASWQWVAGSGTDSSPYFRIFNPITQGERFDEQGEYTKKYVPELSKLPNKYLFSPWLAPKDILNKAGIILGKDYPLPIVDISSSRKVALEAYSSIK